MKELNGVDVDVETSLKEYGFAWEETETDYKIWLGCDNNGSEYTSFDWVAYRIDTDVYKEFDWVEFDRIYSLTGMIKSDWDDLQFPLKVYDIVAYYGSHELTGYTRYTYEEVIS